MTASPSAPPSSATTGSNDVARGSVAITSGRTYGRLARTRSNGPASPSGQQVGLRERDPVGDRMTDGVLAGQPERVRGDVDRQDLDRLERPEPPERDRQRDGDRAAPRPDVHDPERRAPRPDAATAPSRRMISACASSTRRSVSGRGMSARASASNASP